MFCIFSSKSQDSLTHLLLGDNDVDFFSYDISELNSEQITNYNEFINFVGNYSYIKIINTPTILGLTRVIPDDVSNDIIEMDYNLFTKNQKEIINNLYNSLINN